MDDKRRLAIANLEAAVSLLRSREEQLQSLIASDLTSPDMKLQALGELARMLDRAYLALAIVEDVSAPESKQ